MRISDWSSDVCASDLPATLPPGLVYRRFRVSCERIEYLQPKAGTGRGGTSGWLQPAACVRRPGDDRVTIGLGITERPERALPRGTANSYTGRVLHSGTESANQYILYAERSEEHTSELQSLMRISYA